MSRALTFVGMDPAAVAPLLDDESVHLWRLPYASSQGRTPLVSLLATYLGVPTATVALEHGAHGKPRLAAPADSPEAFHQLAFNWSHSGGQALIALARGTQPGVDIEHAVRRPRTLDIARRFFDPGEAEALATLGSAARDKAFIALWCAKEAVLKAEGEGLSFGLARLAFTLDPGHHWRLVRADRTLGQPSDWQLAGFEVATDYRGALAWRGNPRKIQAFHLQHAVTSA